MSGHSKWATIKHKKAALDAKRGKAFTRIIKEIAIAARNGGDPDSNPRLRTAILAAKAASMPADNIKRAVQRGTGELEGGQIEEVMFEAYGPGGTAVLVQAVTDNRNRTVSEIRHLFAKHGGKLGEHGSVSRLFERKSQVLIPLEKVSEDDLMTQVLDAGVEDIRDDGTSWEVLSPPEAHEAIMSAVQRAGLEATSAEVAMIPITTVKLEGKEAAQMLKLGEALEEHDDVQNVYANFDIDEKVMEALAQA
ncbi:MAG: YebC/PmpR family DNA-binding transcriptional regulator [Acidobacteriota bacterium]